MGDDEATATEDGLDAPPRSNVAVTPPSPQGLATTGTTQNGTPGQRGPRERGASSGPIPGLEGLDHMPPAEAVKGPSGWIYHGSSLMCLKPHHFPRKLLIALVESWVFEPAIALTIAANLVTMAATSPLDPPGTPKALFIASCEWIYLLIFTFELVVKIIAYGFIGHSHSYLRDSWCILDFIVVSLAWVPIVYPSFGNYTVLRTLRTLRPLRTLRFVPGMPVLISSIFKAIPPLGNVAGLCSFLFLIFGIVGEELFEGSLHYRCADPLHPLDDVGEHRRLKGGGGGGEFVPFCNPSNPIECSEEEQCIYHEGNPEDQSVHFDSVIDAAMAMVQVITFDTWSNVMYDLMRSFSSYVWIYFFLVAMLGGFFVVNLFLAVVFDEFMRSKATDEIIEAQIKKREDAEKSEGNMNGGQGKEGYGRLDDSDSPVAQGGFGPLRPLIESQAFMLFTVILLVGNMVVMCLPYAEQTDEWADFIEQTSQTLTYLFVVEIGLKFLGLGYSEFVSEGWNIFDAFLIAISAIDIAFVAFTSADEEPFNVMYFRVLRMLRVLRMMRVMKYWEGLFRIFTCLVGAAGQVANIFVLLFIFMTMFSLLGMQIFGGQCGSEDSRFHFDYYVPAMLTVLSVFSGGWVDPYVACSQAGLGVARAYFVAALIIGFFVIFNLFIAILLDSFAQDDEEGEDEDDADGEKEKEEVSTEAESKYKPLVRERTSSWKNVRTGPVPESSFRKFCYQLVQHPTWETCVIIAILVSSIFLVLDSPRLDKQSTLKIFLENANYFFTALFVLELLFKMAAYDLFVEPHGYMLSSWNILDLVIVFVSIVSLCPEFGKLAVLRLLRVLRPLRLLSRIEGMKVIFEFFYRASGDVINVTGVVLFFQTTFAVLGMELFMGQFGSCTDSSITVREDCYPIERARVLSEPAPTLTVIAHDSVWGKTTPATRMNLRNLTAPPAPLTPLRSAPPMNADDDTAHKMTNQLVHANRRDQLISRRRLKGGGGGKSDDNSHLPTQWLNPAFGSFDDFGSAMLLLFIASTGDGWEDFMFRGMDVVGVNIAPQRNDFSPHAFYFIMWLMIGTFTTINLFVGSVVDNFTKIKADIEGSATLTPAQKQWQRTMQESMQSKRKPPPPPPPPPRSVVLRPFYDLVTSKAFDIFITIVIISNILVMGVDFHRIEEDPFWFAFYSNGLLAFGCIYYGECVVKLLGLGFPGYFRDGWNRFDFFLVATSLLDQYASELLGSILPIPPMLLRILRVARIMRIMRLLKGLKGLRDLLMTMVLSFPSFINVGGLLLLVTFIYAVLGVNLFTFVKSGEEMNDYRNFDNFGSAYLLLMQCLTGDNWSGLMYDAMVGPERGCDPDAVPTDCGSVAAIPFFISYTIIGAFILLNLIVAVILENFTALGDLNTDLVSAENIADFGELWSTVDTESAGCLTEQEVAKLLLQVPKPLGFGDNGWDEATSLSKVKSFNLTNGYDNFVNFEEVVDALVALSYINEEISEEMISELDRPRDDNASQSETLKRNKSSLREVFNAVKGGEVSPEQAAAGIVDKWVKATNEGKVNATNEVSRENHDAPARASPMNDDHPQSPSPSKVLGNISSAWKSRLNGSGSNGRGANGNNANGNGLYGGTTSPVRHESTMGPVVMPAVRRPGAPTYGSNERIALPDPAALPPPGAYPPSPTPNNRLNGSQVYAPPRPPPGSAPPLPPGWFMAIGPKCVYYYNVDTRQVSWQPPADWLRAERRRRRQSASPEAANRQMNGLEAVPPNGSAAPPRRKGWDA